FVGGRFGTVGYGWTLLALNAIACIALLPPIFCPESSRLECVYDRTKRSSTDDTRRAARRRGRHRQARSPRLLAHAALYAGRDPRPNQFVPGGRLGRRARRPDRRLLRDDQAPRDDRAERTHLGRRYGRR